VEYREFPARPELRRHVECVWTVTDGDPAPGPVDAIVPDACMELIVHVGAPFRQWRDGGAEAEAQSRSVLVGQIRRPLLVQSGGPVATVGLRFRPGGARPFFRLDLHEIAGRVVPLADLCGAAAAALEERLAGTAPPEAWSAAVQAWLLGRAGGPEDAVVDAIVREILARGGAVRVGDLCRQAGLSQRQLARRFQSAVGLGPKAVSRIVRVQAVLRAVARRPTSWIQVALDHGYADQAHLIRDFVEITGRTPPALREEETPFAGQFTDPARLDAYFAG
jgi:AraC-like DNA-binding protein